MFAVFSSEQYVLEPAEKNQMENKNILITGSSGYVGSHTVKFLSKKGWNVFGLDRVPSLPKLAPYLSDFVKCCISDEEKISAFIRKHHITSAIHCAALCLVAESVEKPALYFQNNVVFGKKLISALKSAGVENIVFSSTAATYGEPTRMPIPESHPQTPINPYGQSKLDFEKHLLSLSNPAFRVGIVRYFNVSGADFDGELGEHHDPETHLIPNAILALLKHKTFQVFGLDFNTRDGTCERDFIHALDLALAHELLIERLRKGHTGEVYNLGVGQGYTILEVLREIEKQTQQKIKVNHAVRRPGDPSKLVADPTLASTQLKWKPLFSDLQTIISSALKWHKSNNIK